jgi:hypothetical protein
MKKPVKRAAKKVKVVPHGLFVYTITRERGRPIVVLRSRQEEGVARDGPERVTSAKSDNR